VAASQNSINRMSPSPRRAGLDLLVACRARARQPAGSEVISSASRRAQFPTAPSAEELRRELRIPARAPLPTETRSPRCSHSRLARALASIAGHATEATKEWLWTIRGMDDRKAVGRPSSPAQTKPGTGIDPGQKVFAHNFRSANPSPYRECFAENGARRSREPGCGRGGARKPFIIVQNPPRRDRPHAGMRPPRSGWRRECHEELLLGAAARTGPQCALGTYYLKHVLNQFDGSPFSPRRTTPPTRAACGAARSVEGAVFVETIPFGRPDYVKNDDEHGLLRRRPRAEPTPLKARLARSCLAAPPGVAVIQTRRRS